MISVQPEWCKALPLQQQSVLLLATRGPDGLGKNHPCKLVHCAYRATVLLAGKYGRPLEWGEKADGFMSLEIFSSNEVVSPGMCTAWDQAVQNFFRNSDELPLHYYTHLMHGAEICGYKHPDPRFRERWLSFYSLMVENCHLRRETQTEMDLRLGDWGREHWDPSEKHTAPRYWLNAREATAMHNKALGYSYNEQDLTAAIATIDEQTEILLLLKEKGH